jgi:hypothetical protein
MKFVLMTATAALLAMSSAAFAASGSSGASNNDTSRSNLTPGAGATVGGSMKDPGGTATGAPSLAQPLAPQQTAPMSSGATGNTPYATGASAPSATQSGK